MTPTVIGKHTVTCPHVCICQCSQSYFEVGQITWNFKLFFFKYVHYIHKGPRHNSSVSLITGRDVSILMPETCCRMAQRLIPTNYFLWHAYSLVSQNHSKAKQKNPLNPHSKVHYHPSPPQTYMLAAP